jgi:hypothetical protein
VTLHKAATPAEVGLAAPAPSRATSATIALLGGQSKAQGGTLGLHASDDESVSRLTAGGFAPRLVPAFLRRRPPGSGGRIHVAWEAIMKGSSTLATISRGRRRLTPSVLAVEHAEANRRCGMKCFTTIIATLFLMLMYVPSTSADTYQYGWTISNSNVEPFSSTGAPGGGLTTLYLWLECVTKDGVASAEFDLAVTGAGSSILAFTPTNGFLNAGGATNLLLAATGCPGDGDPPIPIVAGSILVIDVGAEFCIVPSAANNRSVSVDCSQTDPLTHDNTTTGYSSLGPPSCDDRTGPAPGVLCPWTSVDDSSWGEVKSLYR